jgi:hypothetical protein
MTGEVGIFPVGMALRHSLTQARHYVTWQDKQNHEGIIP